MFNTGKGIEKDMKEAVKWYKLAADKGDSDAMANLGVIYSDNVNYNKKRIFYSYCFRIKYTTI